MFLKIYFSEEGERKELRLFFQKQQLAGKMKFIGFLFFCMLMNMLTDARSIQEGDDLYREPVAMPYWPFSSSDFWSYVEYFRALGAYDRIDEMARALFAQLPVGSHLGYQLPGHEH
uniref:Otospiralin n=2 Tax=Anatinae TaxID=2068716 RepID=A0A8B9UUK1_9AVES